MNDYVQDNTPEDGVEVDIHAHIVSGVSSTITTSSSAPFKPQILLALGRDDEGNLLSALVHDSSSEWTQRDFLHALSRIMTDAMMGGLN